MININEQKRDRKLALNFKSHEKIRTLNVDYDKSIIITIENRQYYIIVYENVQLHEVQERIIELVRFIKSKSSAIDNTMTQRNEIIISTTKKTFVEKAKNKIIEKNNYQEENNYQKKKNKSKYNHFKIRENYFQKKNLN